MSDDPIRRALRRARAAGYRAAMLDRLSRDTKANAETVSRLNDAYADAVGYDADQIQVTHRTLAAAHDHLHSAARLLESLSTVADPDHSDRARRDAALSILFDLDSGQPSPRPDYGALAAAFLSEHPKEPTP